MQPAPLLRGDAATGAALGAALELALETALEAEPEAIEAVKRLNAPTTLSTRGNGGSVIAATVGGSGVAAARTRAAPTRCRCEARSSWSSSSEASRASGIVSVRRALGSPPDAVLERACRLRGLGGVGSTD